jgi:hypothetical protein
MFFRELRHKIWNFRQALKVFFAKHDEAVYLPHYSCIECRNLGIWVNIQSYWLAAYYCTYCDGYWVKDREDALKRRVSMRAGLPPTVKRLK